MADFGGWRNRGFREMRLIALADADFGWLSGERPPPADLRLPPGGVDTLDTLDVIRDINAALVWAGTPGVWMMTVDGEVVGLCGYRAPPEDGEVEIGYGVAAACRRRGHATAAVSAILALASADPTLRVVRAVTASDNLISQRVLARSGFTPGEVEMDPNDGQVIRWRRPIR
jgi:RimJ/RimL family protein N-acetyltransferase